MGLTDGAPRDDALFELPDSVDLLIVGSGPVGATFARLVHDGAPAARILMVEVGPQVADPPGLNTRNLPEPERSTAQLRSQGPDGVATSATGQVDGVLAARPGTYLVRPAEPAGDPQQGMPAAAMSSNVGGMGSHWTCACPAPGDSERIEFIPEADFDSAFARALELLSVTSSAFAPSPAGRRVLELLSAYFDAGRPVERRVQPMPLACRPQGGGLPLWSGAAQVLGPLAEGEDEHFTLSPQTLCRRLIKDGDRIVAAELEHLPSGEARTIAVRVVAVAADALRTPQLLWASGIRPRALGHYLNDQPQIISAVAVPVPEVDPASDDRDSATSEVTSDERDNLTGVTWVPFHEPDHPYHTQVMQLDASPIVVETEGGPKNSSLVGFGYFTTKELRYEDAVTFSPDEVDGYGMPAIRIDYELTPGDLKTIDEAMSSLTRAAAALGPFLPEGEPRLLPAGSSMHYQGSVRMGPRDDGTSVCDAMSRVWDTDNLFVGGNGVIPTPTACNPTATSVALAVISTRLIVDLLSR